MHKHTDVIAMRREFGPPTMYTNLHKHIAGRQPQAPAQKIDIYFFFFFAYGAFVPWPATALGASLHIGLFFVFAINTSTTTQSSRLVPQEYIRYGMNDPSLLHHTQIHTHKWKKIVSERIWKLYRLYATKHFLCHASMEWKCESTNPLSLFTIDICHRRLASAIYLFNNATWLASDRDQWVRLGTHELARRDTLCLVHIHLIVDEANSVQCALWCGCEHISVHYTYRKFHSKICILNWFEIWSGQFAS